ncbi:zinc-dependent alcohol dehydrogenase [Kineococcus rubinsiae]|uniref:zinc-dependent alcohol dehydrogenase n=1 Tax=Kineococcus rubinsiae TaxID=2609562 RepID=UPI0014300139|nr:alcohol dehydrogenase catalytic domain-containing protein [Kineococcus rubinsiae]NIZ90010.1 alcohol dehydrogenase catalytic domain-containing protein [Kineococcus rubinsiae]
MRAAVFHGPGDLRIEEVPRTVPGPGEVSVAVHAAATCGTDLKSYRRGHPKLFPVLPSRFGHEFAGVVDEVGPGVEGFEVGQRVVAANTAPCGHCWACTKQRPSLCENLEFLNGAFAEQVVIPAAIVSRNTYVLPDSVSFASAAPLEPLATVVHGMAEAGIALGDTVVVHGCGPIGLMFVRLSRLRGARVIATDRSATRLAQAREAGAHTVDLTDLATTADRSAAVRELTEGGRGADVAVEAVGLPEVWEQTVESLRPGGTALLFGGPKAGSRFSVDAVAMHYSEYTLKGVFHHTPQYVKTALDLLSSGDLDGESLISERRPLEALVESLEDMAAGRGAKYLLTPLEAS